MKLTNEHIEEQILLMLDGELSETDAAALFDWIGQHPEHRQLLEAYRSAYSEADQAMIFPDKESLLQPEESIVLTFPGKRRVWMRTAAAVAAVVCVTVAGYLLRKDQPAEHGSMATNHKKALQAPVASVRDTVKVLALQVPATVQRPAQAVQPVQVQHKAVTQQQTPVVIPSVPVREDKRTMETLAMIEESPVTMEQQGPVTGISWERSGNIAAAAFPETQSAWGPVKGESLEGINELVSRVQAIRNNIAGKAKSLKHATFVLRLGDKEIAIGK